MLQAYYRLTKPGIIYGNSLNVGAGYLLAAGIMRHWDLWLLLAILAGSALVMAAGCVFNNYIDRGIDHKMQRTKKRALVTGDIPVPAALLYGTMLLAAGFAVLATFTNRTTVLVGLTGFVFYVVFYSWAKRSSVHGTLVGSVSGAIPPVAGYTAVTADLDAAALILFAILVTWQMPHFYAIAIYRLKEYAAAGLPVWPVKRGIGSAKKQIVGWVFAFWFTACLLTAFAYTGFVYLAGVTALGALWFWNALQGAQAKDDAAWARHMFKVSLLVTLGIDVLLAVGALLP
jgi:protoheme IX farnesyltransferase